MRRSLRARAARRGAQPRLAAWASAATPQRALADPGPKGERLKGAHSLLRSLDVGPATSAASRLDCAPFRRSRTADSSASLDQGPAAPRSGARRAGVKDPPQGLKGRTPGFEDRTSSFEDRSPGLRERMTSFADPRSSLRDPATSFADPTSSLRGRMTSFADPTSSLQDPTSSFGDRSSSLRGRMSSFEDRSLVPRGQLPAPHLSAARGCPPAARPARSPARPGGPPAPP